MKIEKFKNTEFFKTRINKTREIISVKHIARIHLKESEYQDMRDFIDTLIFLDNNLGICFDNFFNTLDSVDYFNPKYVDVYTDGERKFFMYNRYIIKVREVYK